MKIGRLPFMGALVLLTMFFQACPRAGSGNKVLSNLELEVIYTSAHCNSGEKRVTVSWISGPETLRLAMGGGRGPVLGAERAAPPIDFRAEGVLRVGIGLKTSAGYGFDKKEVVACIENGTATVRLALTTPPAGALVAQVLTDPCLLIRMPRGNYSRILVVDQQGQLLGEIENLDAVTK